MKANKARAFKPATIGRRFEPPEQTSTRTPSEQHHLYNNDRWRRFRHWFLNRHPVCAICEADGRLTASTVVDHIEPHRGDLDLFWDKTNHQALCASCHGSKSAGERISTRQGAPKSAGRFLDGQSRGAEG